MAFDAGMLASAVSEIKKYALGGRIEKISQPERDEIVIQLRTLLGGRKILINAGSNNPRIGFSALQKENPATPPMFCTLLRKHINGGKLALVEQLGFERAVKLGFDCRDEMGFECRKYLIAEVMGKYSNLIFADENMKVIAAHRPVDFTTSSRRQVLSGMRYELPPPQEKADPTKTDREEFMSLCAAASPEKRADKFITESYLGISSAVAREIVYRARGSIDVTLGSCRAESLWREFSRVMRCIAEEDFSPSMVLLDGRMTEYAFIELSHYGVNAEVKPFESVGELLDAYYGGRDREQKIKQRASDLLHIISAAEARISRKLENQRRELVDCERGEEFKTIGDLITANMYAIKKGDGEVLLTDYSEMKDDGSFAERLVKLDIQLTPAQNAQKFYKKYNKSKHAKVELTHQIELGEAELEYLRSVSDALDRAETTEDMIEIREELYRSGYASRMKGYTPPKKVNPKVMKFVTDGGYTILCGKNNTQNEYITHKLADRNDYWFHVKGQPGSHVVMVCEGEEPSELDFTQAARIAALYSSAAEGRNVAVDYTLVRNLKKAPGAKPGFVIYHTNWSAYVTPDAAEAERLRVKK